MGMTPSAGDKREAGICDMHGQHAGVGSLSVDRERLREWCPQQDHRMRVLLLTVARDVAVWRSFPSLARPSGGCK